MMLPTLISRFNAPKQEYGENKVVGVINMYKIYVTTYQMKLISIIKIDSSFCDVSLK